MSLRTATRPWLPLQRLGEDVLQLPDGSLRGVLECGASALTTNCPRQPPPHALQLVARARRAPSPEAASARSRLRASHAELLAELQPGRRPFVRQFFVVVPWEVAEGGEGPELLDLRLRRIADWLQRGGLEPVRVKAAGLDAPSAVEDIEEGWCEVRLGGCLARTLAVTAHPERLRSDQLDSLEADHDLSLHVRPVAPAVVQLSAYLTIWAESRDDLDEATRRAEALLHRHSVCVRRPLLEAGPALASGLPLCLDLAGARKEMPVSVLSTNLAPLGEDRGQEAGLLYGLDPGTRRPFFFDRFASPGPHLILGDAASGKSFRAKIELLRARMAGVQVHVIDPRGAYVPLLSALGGTVIAPSLEGISPFQPFAVRAVGPGALSSRLATLAALVELLAGGLTSAQQVAVEEALAFTYALHGYTDDGDNSRRVPPDLAEVVAALEPRAAAAGTGSDIELSALGQRLERWVSGDGGRLLEGSAQQPPTASLTGYTLAGLPEAERPAAMLLSLDRIWTGLPDDGRRTLIVLDEVASLLPHPACARLLAAAAERRARFTFVTGDVSGLMRSPLREAVTGAGLTELTRQSPEAMAELAQLCRLTPSEQDWLLGAHPNEGLLLAEGKRLALEVVTSQEERRLITGGLQ